VLLPCETASSRNLDRQEDEALLGGRQVSSDRSHLFHRAGEEKLSAAISGDDAMRAWAECRGLHRRYSAGVKRETSKSCRDCAIEEANRACRRPFVKSRLRCNRGCESHGLSEAERILRRTKCSRRRRQTRIDEHAHRARVPTTDVAATLVRHHDVGLAVPRLHPPSPQKGHRSRPCRSSPPSGRFHRGCSAARSPCRWHTR
jgi:hypothetical protein